jgi:ligand-binding sensor domain-containing protein/serine phosphatase RsbU (regulator of sigma subunit)
MNYLYYSCRRICNLRMRLKTLTLILLLVHSLSSYSQNSRFKNYSVTEGLCHPFIYNINQDKNGFIWIGTGEGLCRYDGYMFTKANAQDSLPIEVVNVTYCDSLGNLWIGYNNGSIWSYDGNYFTEHKLESDVSASITGITQNIDGGILFSTQNSGLYKLNEKGKPVSFSPSFKNQMISAVHARGRNLLIGTQNGLFVYDLKNETDTIPVLVNELKYIKIQAIKDANNGNSFWVGTEDAGLFFVTISSDSVRATSIGKEYGLGNENVQDMTYDDDANLWVSSFTSGLWKLSFDMNNKNKVIGFEKYDRNSGLSSNYVKCVFKDREGNLWAGTYGGGFALLTNQALGFHSYENTKLGNNVISISINDSILWLGGENGILQVNRSTNRSVFFNGANGLPNDQITSLYYRSGILWVGTSKSGLYKHIKGSGRFNSYFKTDNTISNAINYITGDAENVYIATKNGIFVLNPSTGQQLHYNTLNGLPHNDIEHLFLDSENRLLFATRTNGIYEINERGEVEEFFTVGKYELDFNSITQDKKGNIWVSTYGQGVFLLRRDSVINFTAREGLKSNYCYSISAADGKYIWVGHRLGLSRIDVSNLSITVFGSDNGITGDCNLNASKLSNDNVIYFGATDGIITYDTKKDKKEKLNPKNNILKVFISDKEYDFRKPIVLPYGAYKLRIEYIGLNYSDPKAVSYQYKLDGYDLGWSEVTDARTAIYPRIEDGNFTFLLKSNSDEGISNQGPVSFIIKVKLPVWKTWWFITLVVIIVVLVVLVIIKYRERKQKQIQEYLEQRLNERTREVVEQKEEIEIKNRDITDSINYAQRIQASILPPIKRLQQTFSGSFIFYQPRDIVSGDFYWFDRVNENKLIIVCADSTGHGVPGAFMSMIGTTLIKDVCSRDDINSPSEVLCELDQEIRATLNQNIDVEKSNDGMDIIVCEIDVRNYYLRYASAMRPMIVYKNGNQIYVKGSRSSVGGQYDKDEKIFKDEGIQLDKGDLIYMFSDGYSDQFGGPIGKKFKMVRLKNLLRDIYQKPMEEQYEYIKSTFNLWKEDHEQVDDVLFMGIKI